MSGTKTVENNVETVVARAVDLLPTQASNIRGTASASRVTYTNKIVYVTGTLAEVLAVQGVAGAYSVLAMPSDVQGCSAQYRQATASARPGWSGCIGVFDTDADFAAYVFDTSNLTQGAWVLVGNNTTGTTMKVFQQ